MQIKRIRKKTGGHRTICVPDPKLKEELRQSLEELEFRSRMADIHGVVHGFVKGRSPVTNAACHIGRRYTISADLKDFFDSVTPDKVRHALTDEEIGKYLPDPGDGNGPRALQGLPTSPAVANLAAAPMDREIVERLVKPFGVVYTRYADDLTISFDDRSIKDAILAAMAEIVARHGFRIAPGKTHFMSASAGRRVICGVAVDDGLYAPRKTRRRLRAARHNAEKSGKRQDARRARGLAEWCAMKRPAIAGPIW